MTEDEPYDYGELLVLQHAEYAGPGTLAELLDVRSNRRPWQLVHVPDAGLPDLSDRIRGVLILGGPMGVTDTSEHPWITGELGLIRSAAEAGVPVLGICLGAQLLATALGGAVTRRATPGLGFVALNRTEEAGEDRVFAGWTDGARVFFAHDDQVSTLPEGATPMLNGTEGAPSAWRAPDGLSYGLQFHPEVDAVAVADWQGRERGQRMAAEAGVDAEALIEEARRRDRFTRAAGVSLVGRWVDGVVGRDDPTPRKRRPAA